MAEQEYSMFVAIVSMVFATVTLPSEEIQSHNQDTSVAHSPVASQLGKEPSPTGHDGLEDGTELRNVNGLKDEDGMEDEEESDEEESDEEELDEEERRKVTESIKLTCWWFLRAGICYGVLDSLFTKEETRLAILLVLLLFIPYSLYKEYPILTFGLCSCYAQYWSEGFHLPESNYDRINCLWAIPDTKCLFCHVMTSLRQPYGYRLRYFEDEFLSGVIVRLAEDMRPLVEVISESVEQFIHGGLLGSFFGFASDTLY